MEGNRLLEISQESAIVEAIETGNIESLLQLLLTSPGFDINKPLNHLRDGQTALFIACRTPSREAVVEALLEHGADVNVRCKTFMDTPLHVVCGLGNASLAERLVARGASVGTANKSGLLPFDYVCDVAVAEVLMRAGASVRVSGMGSPLHAAPNAAVAAFLLAHGASPNAINRDNRTPLFPAAHNNRLDVIVVLLHSGAEVNWVDDEGHTPLSEACRYGRPSTVQLLLEYGAATALCLEYDQTLMEVVVELGYDAILAVLNRYQDIVSREWRPSHHVHYPLPFRKSVSIVLSLWSWDHGANAPWHPESAFVTLSFELLREVFVWLAAGIVEEGYQVVDRSGREPSFFDRSGEKEK